MPSNHAPQPGAWVAAFAGLGLAIAAAWFGWPVWLVLASGVVGGLGLGILIRGRRPEDWITRADDIASSLDSAPGSGDVIDRIARGVRGLLDRAATLQQSNSRLGAMVDSVPTPLLTVDARGVITLENRAAAELFASRGSLRGRRLDECFTQQEVLTLHASAVRGGVARGQIRVGGAPVQVLEVVACPILPPGGGATPGGPTPGGPEGGVLLALRDVTEWSLAAQLKTDFVANASHELRTPLASIRGAIETLGDGAWEDPSMRARLSEMIATNVGRLEDLVRDLLDLSRLESPDQTPQTSPVRASEVASGLRELFAPALEARGLTLRFDLDPALERMDTDPRLLQIILRNLVENSTKFAFDRTEIVVTGRALRPREGRPRGDAVWTVTDRGIGIPIEHQQRIFERFFQVDGARSGEPTKRGTGLGLAIVKHAVRTLGGSIDVESVWKKGTTMTVKLPACVRAVA